jgi:hypothetical protein
MQDSIFSTLGLVWGVLFLGAPGAACTFYPRAVQKIAAKPNFGPITNLATHIKFMRNSIESERYVRELRFCGVLALAAVAGLLYVFVRTLMRHFNT